MFENIPRFSCVFIAQPVMKSKLSISLFGQTPFLYLMGFDYCVQREPVSKKINIRQLIFFLNMPLARLKINTFPYGPSR